MATESVDEIKRALKQDFNKLYVKGFTTDWEVQRLVRSAEIDVMSLSALQAYYTRECARKVSAALMKATMSLPSLQDAKVTLPPGLAGEEMKWRQGFKAGVNAVEAELRAAIERLEEK